MGVGESMTDSGTDTPRDGSKESTAFSAVNRAHRVGLIKSDERQAVHDAIAGYYRGSDAPLSYSQEELHRFCEERDADLKEEHQNIAEGHEPPQEREGELAKIEKRREELRFIKRLISHDAITDYPELPEGWEG